MTRETESQLLAFCVRQHGDFDAGQWLSYPHTDRDELAAGIGNESRAIHLRVLTPVDLAVSKISRFSRQDQGDILALARTGRVTAPGLRQRTTEALEYYVGDTRWIHQSLDMISAEIESF